MAKQKSPEEIFKKIRIDFLFQNPFLSVLAMSLPILFDEEQTVALKTDGRRIYVSSMRLPEYSESEIKYQFAHILLHVILKHPFRVGKRDLETWNLASDLVINLILDEMRNVGKRPDDEPLDERYKDMTVEEVYTMIQEENTEAPEEDEESEQKIDLIPNDAKEDGEEGDELDTLIIQALNVAKQQGALPGQMAVEVDELVQPNISLDEILHEYLNQSLFEKQYAYVRPNRKFIHQNLYLPGTVRPMESLHAFIAIDSSLSVSQDEYKAFLGTLKSIIENYYEYRLEILPFDNKIKTDSVMSITNFDGIEDRDLYIPKAEGGTDFDCVIEYIEENQQFYERNLLMVLTDGHFPLHKNNDMEKLFLITDKDNIFKFEPYGKVVQFRL